jgi:hypothetical protein
MANRSGDDPDLPQGRCRYPGAWLPGFRRAEPGSPAFAGQVLDPGACKRRRLRIPSAERRPVGAAGALPARGG